MPHPEPLSGLDAAFLALDTRTTPMHMGAIGVFTPIGELDPRRLTAVLMQRAGKIPQLRMRVRSSRLPTSTPVWRPDPRFDAARHIRVARIGRAEDPDALERYASEWIARPLPQGQPLWSLEIVPGLANGDFAMLLKLHHAITDGAGAVEVAAGLLDDVALRRALTRASEPPAPRIERGRDLFSFGRAALSAVPAAARSVGRNLERAIGTAELGYQVARAIRPGHTSPLGATNSTSRGLKFVRLDTADLRRIRKLHGGTPNDVALAVLAGALRAWLAGRDEAVDGVTLRALIPVSLRGRNLEQSGGNRLSGYLCDLPIGVADPIGRLRVVRAAMDRNKSAGPLKGAGALPMLANQIPAPVHLLATGLIGDASNALFDTVVTNVGLPSIPLSLDGAALRASYPVVPLAPGQALGVAISPYRDTVHIGLHADGQAIPDLDTLAHAVEKETTRLHELCM
ncbi:MAG: wax ester/triacylglycerol synthase family O-acyltransferase [Haloechinothrix sp.]